MAESASQEASRRHDEDKYISLQRLRLGAIHHAIAKEEQRSIELSVSIQHTKAQYVRLARNCDQAFDKLKKVGITRQNCCRIIQTAPLERKIRLLETSLHKKDAEIASFLRATGATDLAEDGLAAEEFRHERKRETRRLSQFF